MKNFIKKFKNYTLVTKIGLLSSFITIGVYFAGFFDPIGNIIKTFFIASMLENELNNHIISKIIIDETKTSLEKKIITIFKSHREANRKNAELLCNSKESVKILTIHGGSWLKDFEVQPNFERSLNNIKVFLLMVNPHSNAFQYLSDSRIIGFEKKFGFERLSTNSFTSHFDYYRSLLKNGTYKNNLTIRLFDSYPWIRFSIYDNVNYNVKEEFSCISY